MCLIHLEWFIVYLPAKGVYLYMCRSPWESQNPLVFSMECDMIEFSTFLNGPGVQPHSHLSPKEALAPENLDEWIR